MDLKEFREFLLSKKEVLINAETKEIKEIFLQQDVTKVVNSFSQDKIFARISLSEVGEKSVVHLTVFGEDCGHFSYESFLVDLTDFFESKEVLKDSFTRLNYIFDKAVRTLVESYFLITLCSKHFSYMVMDKKENEHRLNKLCPH